MKLIFLHGLPGVGKLTVARELAKLTSFRIFHNHLAVDLAESVFEFGSPPFVELREKVWLEDGRLIKSLPEDTMVEAVVGHMYLLHTKGNDRDLYIMFRVESLKSGDEVTNFMESHTITRK